MDDDASGELDLSIEGLPPYVEESLRAWCAWDRARRHAQGRERITEAEERYRRDPTYDRASDWLDEPFPEELR